MFGYILALITAFLSSFRILMLKKVSRIDEYVVAFVVSLFTASFLFVGVVFTGIPELGPRFFPTLVLSGTLLSLATVFYVKALQCSDLSVASPITSFTPLFLLLTSPLIIGEFPGTNGLLGVLLIVFGGYVLHIKKKEVGILAPIKHLFYSKGSRYMLLVALIFSVTSALAKVGIENSSTFFWPFAKECFIVVLLLPMYLMRSKRARIVAQKEWKLFVILAFFGAASLMTHMLAYTFTLVVYVISIKRLNTVLAVLWGWLFLGEKNIEYRLFGAFLMFLGVVFIAINGS